MMDARTLDDLGPLAEQRSKTIAVWVRQNANGPPSLRLSRQAWTDAFVRRTRGPVLLRAEPVRSKPILYTGQPTRVPFCPGGVPERRPSCTCHGRPRSGARLRVCDASLAVQQLYWERASERNLARRRCASDRDTFGADTISDTIRVSGLSH